MARITEEYSCTLVGKFMREWAIAEAELDKLIATALRIDNIESWVISTAIPVSHKWNIAKSFVRLSQMNDVDKTEFKSLEKCFNELVAARNIVAHCMFSPEVNENVVIFLRFASKGTLKSELDKWPESQFLKHVESIRSFKRGLEVLGDKLEESKLLPRPTLAQLLSGV